ncbi:hypothetical protein BGP89_09060 [Luteimonas sp. JM171]|uniref:hypothetical protein n=1 Tax=Luteimonas sp. JM171 TaxID=1896164 RepID=UPI001F25567B|nr:hypothetical protein [Luteimonas sp. JM171]
MEPITTAAAFASIVGLLSDFVSHRDTSDAKGFDDFMAWLSENRHEELRNLLQSNTTTTLSIKALFNESRQEIIDRLSSLDKSLASVASGIDLYRGLAASIHPEALLSEQAMSVLGQFYDSGASKLLEGKMMSGVILLFIDGKNGTVEFPEPRFIEDDLDTLLSLGLLGLTHNGKGERVFKFTRAAAVLVEQSRGA